MGHVADHSHVSSHNKLKRFLILALGSVGVVYGDIGTSPLYAFREAMRPIAADGVAREEVVGLISLMIWTLTIIVTFKYVLFLLRADNHGEGGTLSLLALLMKKTGAHVPLLFFMGIAGAALFIGDAMITPALSVLSPSRAEARHPAFRSLRGAHRRRHSRRAVCRAVARHGGRVEFLRPHHRHLVPGARRRRHQPYRR